MTQPDTLHTRLRAELDRRLAVARAAADQYGPCWQIMRIPPYTDPVLLAGDGGDDLLSAGTVDLHETHQAHIALHAPADAIRRYEGELETLERHAPGYPGGEADYGRHTERTESGQYVEVRDAEPTPAYYCERCDDFQPCPEIRSLAHRLGVSVDEANP